MARDEVAIGAPHPPREPCAEALRPFLPWLTGTLLLLGPKPDAGSRARWASDATLVTTADGADLPASALFDGVVLTGLLSCRDDGGRDALDATIAWAQERLRPGGRLILVIDNALSLRGLAAGSETVGQRGFPSLEGRLRSDGLRLPTRAGLKRSLQARGLAYQEWWFPFPGREEPVSFIAERGLARPGGFDPGMLAIGAAGPDPAARAGALFSPRRAWATVAEQGLIGDLAPAFVIAASAEPLPPDDRLAIHAGLRRRPEFERLVTFAEAGSQIAVRRARAYPDLPAAVRGVTNLLPSETYVPGSLWSEVLEARLAREGWCPDAVAAWAGTWLQAVSRRFAAGALLETQTILPGPALDAIPKNLVSGADGTFIDLEWELGGPLDAGHLAVRGLVNALTDARDWRPGGPSTLTLLDALRALLPRLGLALDDAQLADRLARESRFQTIVSDRVTERGLDWAAATRLPVGEETRIDADPRAALAEASAEIARLLEENAALRAARAADAAAHEAAARESVRRTDRVIAYAAEMHRARDHLQGTLDAHRASAGDGSRLSLRLLRLIRGTP
ncbi:hypothetical protein SAMN02799625_00956 [Methylobacterium sp. UNC300MFChir4.1]|uniref:hypothetical protein n=1 Tax=Methylobacterium sp. UNC300MFChir4.1 TaxID=1502747 RepID=UPI0008BFCF24|nr:hypothetical protein [Methylobacterium sp. UNC300MFChir4.1]SEN21126.1 hypothetical protein SAMN02799625_00956 [Methylobacterium sp. UNC300MFChir4.1]